MRIALLAVLAFAGVWLVALRPKPVAGPADAPPPVTAKQPAKPAAAKSGKDKPNGITSAADKAKDAVAGANTAAAKAEGTTAAPKPAAAAKPAAAETTTPATAAKPATKPATTATPATPVKPDPATKEQSAQVREILAELDQGKVAVVLFWERQGSDDRAVRRALAGVDLRGGKVETHIASIDKLALYEPITRGVPVVTSPSLIVIDKNRKARVISGLTITREIDQTVSRALKGK